MSKLLKFRTNFNNNLAGRCVGMLLRIFGFLLIPTNALRVVVNRAFDFLIVAMDHGNNRSPKRQRCEDAPTSPQSLEDGELEVDKELLPSSPVRNVNNSVNSTPNPTPTPPPPPPPPTFSTEKNNEDDDEMDGSAEEGELTVDTEREAIKQQVNEALSKVNDGKSSTPKSVSQKEARYFTLSSVVCSKCGLKGHMSFACTEEETIKRCHICGSKDHTSRDCPQVLDRRLRQGSRRDVGAPRQPILSCYVCHQDGHLDCSMGREPGLMSCSNCGAAGHTGGGCDMIRPHQAIQIIRSFDGERRENSSKSRSKFQKKDERKRERELLDYRTLLASRLNQKGRYSTSNYRGGYRGST